ncbi:MAG TPA: SGNH/GDSL hydrolase family protein [Candidatus Dormibacteraeota bacterium]
MSGVTSPPTAGNAALPKYLALGDSIAFGYAGHPTPPPGGGSPYNNAAAFIGYPAYVGQSFGLDTTNAACPGETSGSFITASAPDNGCHAFKAAFPLHVSYSGESQLQFADEFLKSHSDTQLVTIHTGADDGLLVIEQCGGLAGSACINAELGTTLSTISANLTTIVQSLRANGYDGDMVLVNFYSLNYANAAETNLVRQLNSTIAGVASAQHLELADAFTAFQHAADRTGGDTCATGLLGTGSSVLGRCDLHPDTLGQQLLATTVENAVLQNTQTPLPSTSLPALLPTPRPTTSTGVSTNPLLRGIP